MIFDRVKEELKKNKQDRLDGKDILIPWNGLPKLCTVLPGIQKGRFVITTANSKVGKTQISDYLFLYEPLDYVISNPKTPIKLKIFYFSLEMSKEDKILQMISNKIYKDKQHVISTDNLRSYFKGYILEDRVEQLIDSYKDYFEKVEKFVTFIDDTRNPYGIYKTMRTYARENGKFYQNGGAEVDPEKEYYDYYKPNDENEHVIVHIDSLNLLQAEKGQTLWDAMFKFSSDYCIKLRNRFNYTICAIQQQAADQEKQQFNFRGDSIVDKIRPSADGLADCKLTGRDCDMMIGLFAPSRYKITEYAGYNISKLKDNYRELSIIFNRRGSGSINLDLYFEGASNFFRELDSSEYRV